MHINDLKGINVDRLNDIDQAVAMSAFGRIVEAEYTSFGIDVPEWLTANLRALRRWIKVYRQDNLEAKLRTARQRLEAEKSPTERKKDLRSEVARLEQQLADVD